MKNLFLFGKQHTEEKSKRNAIQLINGFNVVALIVFTMITFFIGINIPHLVFIPITALVLISIPLFLTNKGYYTLSKYILIIIPSYTILLTSSVAKSYGFMNNILMFLAPKILIYAMLISPIIFFGVRKKKNLIISLILVLPSLAP